MSEKLRQYTLVLDTEKFDRGSGLPTMPAMCQRCPIHRDKNCTGFDKFAPLASLQQSDPINTFKDKLPCKIVLDEIADVTNPKDGAAFYARWLQKTSDWNIE